MMNLVPFLITTCSISEKDEIIMKSGTNRNKMAWFVSEVQSFHISSENYGSYCCAVFYSMRVPKCVNLTQKQILVS